MKSEAEKLDKTEVSKSEADLMRLPEDQIKFSYNENLLKEASEIKTERQLLKERLDKLEQTKNAVSPTVYMKVYTDYSTQLDESTQKLMALKRDLDREEKALSEKRSLIEKQIKSHNEAKEENQLRCTLGEISQERADDLNQSHTDEVSRLDRSLHLIKDAIERHQEIFAGEVKTENRKEVLPPHITSEPTPLPPISTPIPEKKITEKKPALKAVPDAPAPAEPAPQKAEHTDRISINTNTEISVSEPSSPSISTAAKTSLPPPEVEVYENEKLAQKISLTKNIVIGRSPASDIVVKEAKVSRKHAEIQIINGKYILIDLESSNGTFVQGKKIKEHTLQSGEQIGVGTVKLIFKQAH